MIQTTEKPLTDKQQSFVEHYCTDASFNATKAYILAGYSSIGADGNASRLIVKDSIKQAIAGIKADISEKFELSKESVVNNLLEDRKMAKDNNNTGCMIRADENLGRVCGAFNADTSGSLSIVDIMAVVGIKAIEGE